MHGRRFLWRSSNSRPKTTFRENSKWFKAHILRANRGVKPFLKLKKLKKHQKRFDTFILQFSNNLSSDTKKEVGGLRPSKTERGDGVRPPPRSVFLFSSVRGKMFWKLKNEGVKSFLMFFKLFLPSKTVWPLGLPWKCALYPRHDPWCTFWGKHALTNIKKWLFWKHKLVVSELMKSVLHFLGDQAVSV